MQINHMHGGYRPFDPSLTAFSAAFAGSCISSRTAGTGSVTPKRSAGIAHHGTASKTEAGLRFHFFLRLIVNSIGRCIYKLVSPTKIAISMELFLWFIHYKQLFPTITKQIRLLKCFLQSRPLKKRKNKNKTKQNIFRIRGEG